MKTDRKKRNEIVVEGKSRAKNRQRKEDCVARHKKRKGEREIEDLMYVTLEYGVLLYSYGLLMPVNWGKAPG